MSCKHGLVAYYLLAYYLFFLIHRQLLLVMFLWRVACLKLPHQTNLEPNILTQLRIERSACAAATTAVHCLLVGCLKILIHVNLDHFSLGYPDVFSSRHPPVTRIAR
jgi:hypothetical protein